MIPDAVGPVLGYRSWRVHDGRLWSVFHQHLWTPGAVEQARCLTPDLRHPIVKWLAPSKRHDAPAAGCSCGFYALNAPPTPTLREALQLVGQWTPLDSYAVGVVEAWGRVAVASRGFKAQRMRVKAILASDSGAVEVSRAYGVPLLKPAA